MAAAQYVLPFRMGWLAVAAFIFGCWLLSMRWRRSLGPIGVWFAGATLVWGLTNSLLLPWMDITKTYRHAFLALARTLPPNTKCVNTIGFGESERTMFQHFTGRVPYQQTPGQDIDCGVTVVMVEGANDAPAAINAGGRLLWSGSRLGDLNRRFLAYRTNGPEIARARD